MAKINRGAMSDANMARFVAQKEELDWDKDLKDKDDIKDDIYLGFWGGYG